MEFEAVWQRYPKKLGKKQALRHFRGSVKSRKDFERINMALDNYLRHIELKQLEWDYIQHGKTWFYNWEDWENYQEPKKERREDAGTREFNKNWEAWKKELQENAR